MKLGITINDEFAEFLEEIAKVNKTTKTTACSVILENFLSYRLSRQEIPIFKRESKLYISKESRVVGVVDPKEVERCIRDLKTPWLGDEDWLMDFYIDTSIQDDYLEVVEEDD